MIILQHILHRYYFAYVPTTYSTHKSHNLLKNQNIIKKTTKKAQLKFLPLRLIIGHMRVGYLYFLFKTCN